MCSSAVIFSNVTVSSRVIDVLAECDDVTAKDVSRRHLHTLAHALRCRAQSVFQLQVILVLLLSVGPCTSNWKRGMEVLVDRRGDCVLASVLHRVCQQQQQQNHHQQRELCVIALYTLSSFFIDAPKRLVRNFIEEGGAALLSATVKYLTSDIAALNPTPASSHLAPSLFNIVWSLVVNATCLASFDDVFQSPSLPLCPDMHGLGAFRVKEMDGGDGLGKLRFVNQEFLPVSS